PTMSTPSSFILPFRLLFLCFLLSRHLLSFPTRRSSDLILLAPAWVSMSALCADSTLLGSRRTTPPATSRETCTPCSCSSPATTRSEEHTSELQSRFDLVCRLLLEKKKKKNKNTTKRQSA